jgi:hypothetical protein
MDPSFWGRSAWQFLHTITFNYPMNPTKEDKDKYYKYFESLGSILPCPSCAESYKIYFKQIPINDYLNDTYGITFWLYIIHYIVNKKLSKDTPPFLDVVKIYYPNKSNCPSEVNTAKCTAKPIKNNDIYLQFKNEAEKRYLAKILKQVN